MEQNKELRFLVDTMLKTYDQLNKQIAEELSAGTPIPAKEIMADTSKVLLEYFDKESDYDEVNNEFVRIFETRGFAKRCSWESKEHIILEDLLNEFLDTFSDEELLEFINRTCEFEISGLRVTIGNRLKNKMEKLDRKESA